MVLKCDEGKPWCRRCTKASRMCPGYRDLTIFRASKHGVKLYASRAGQNDRHAQPEYGSHAALTVQPLRPGPSTDWERNAVAYFLSHYVCAPVGEAHGHLDFLPEVFTRNEDVDFLGLSLQAVAFSSLANTSTMTILQRKSSQLYGAALRSIAKRLEHHSSTDDHDLLLVSIFLTQLYEVGI